MNHFLRLTGVSGEPIAIKPSEIGSVAASRDGAGTRITLVRSGGYHVVREDVERVVALVEEARQAREMERAADRAAATSHEVAG